VQKELSDISENEIETFYKTVSDNVKARRMALNMSQLDLALKLGIKSVAFYSNCENLRYRKHFNLEHVYKLAKALDVELCELLKENNHR
jgi:transcriptional regulator with XRE-family HTH domain